MHRTGWIIAPFIIVAALCAATDGADAYRFQPQLAPDLSIPPPVWPPARPPTPGYRAPSPPPGRTVLPPVAAAPRKRPRARVVAIRPYQLPPPHAVVMRATPLGDAPPVHVVRSDTFQVAPSIRADAAPSMVAEIYSEQAKPFEELETVNRYGEPTARSELVASGVAVPEMTSLSMLPSSNVSAVDVAALPLNPSALPRR